MMMIVNRWPCEHISGTVVAMVDKEAEASRIVLFTSTVTLLDFRGHLPEKGETSAWLKCVGYLCATGLEISKKSAFILGYMFPDHRDLIWDLRRERV